MDFSKISSSDKIIGIGAIAAIVGCFLPWYSWYVVSVNGLHGWGLLSFIAAVLALVVVALPLFGQKLPNLGVKESRLQMILAAVVVGSPVIQLLGALSIGGVSFGIFVTIGGGVVMLIGAYQKQGPVKKAG